MSAKSFSDAVALWAKKAGGDIESVATASFIETASAVVKSTPVDKGFLRNNWRVGIDAPVTATLDIPDKSGARAIAEIEGAKIFGRLVYFTNNSPYARRIEYEGWSKIKAPAGMLRINVNNFIDAVNRAVSDVK